MSDESVDLLLGKMPIFRFLKNVTDNPAESVKLQCDWCDAVMLFAEVDDHANDKHNRWQYAVTTIPRPLPRRIDVVTREEIEAVMGVDW